VTDDLSTYGLGALPDPPDARDYPISALYAAEGLTASVVLPASFAAPRMPPAGRSARPLRPHDRAADLPRSGGGMVGGGEPGV
jgi:hypothetical protein